VTAQLKLIALDADDLAVVSAHVQEAHVQAADIIWRQSEKRLVVGMNRLDWEQTMAGEATPRRLISALRFDRVLSCKSRNIDLEAPPEPALELLGIEFHPAEAPVVASSFRSAAAGPCGWTSNVLNASWPTSAPTISEPPSSGLSRRGWRPDKYVIPAVGWAKAPLRRAHRHVLLPDGGQAIGRAFARPVALPTLRFNLADIQRVDGHRPPRH
jgi:Protein of unknown function (DUF2948)